MKKLFKLFLIFIFEKTGIDWMYALKKMRTSGDFLGRIHRAAQIQLIQTYRQLSLGNQGNAPDFSNISFRNHAQNGEDGILLYIFSVIGFGNRKCIEIGCGNGVECNTANLLLNHGFEGLLVDGDALNIRYGKAFYGRNKDTHTWQPRLIHALVNAENVNDLMRQHGFEGEIDLLSIDIDGMDYWVWKAIDSVSPRVVVLECNNLWESDIAKTIPYKPDFISDAPEYYAGASLAAMNTLAREKGYRLIGANKYGFNAFFLRNDIDAVQQFFPEVSPTDCQQHSYCKYAQTIKKEKIIDRDWVDV